MSLTQINTAINPTPAGGGVSKELPLRGGLFSRLIAHVQAQLNGSAASLVATDFSVTRTSLGPALEENAGLLASTPLAAAPVMGEKVDPALFSAPPANAIPSLLNIQSAHLPSELQNLVSALGSIEELDAGVRTQPLENLITETVKEAMRDLGLEPTAQNLQMALIHMAGLNQTAALGLNAVNSNAPFSNLLIENDGKISDILPLAKPQLHKAFMQATTLVVQPENLQQQYAVATRVYNFVPAVGQKPSQTLTAEKIDADIELNIAPEAIIFDADEIVAENIEDQFKAPLAKPTHASQTSDVDVNMVLASAPTPSAAPLTVMPNVEAIQSIQTQIFSPVFNTENAAQLLDPIRGKVIAVWDSTGQLVAPKPLTTATADLLANTDFNTLLDEATQAISDADISATPQPTYNLGGQVLPTGLEARPVNAAAPNMLLANANLGAQVVVQMKTLAGENGGHVRMKLHPAELGEISIEMRIKDGKVHGLIAAQSPEVIGQLTRELQVLKTGFEQLGLSLANEGFQFVLQQNNQQGSGGNAFAQNAPASVNIYDLETAPPTLVTNSWKAADKLVDIRI